MIAASEIDEFREILAVPKVQVPGAPEGGESKRDRGGREPASAKLSQPTSGRGADRRLSVSVHGRTSVAGRRRSIHVARYTRPADRRCGLYRMRSVAIASTRSCWFYSPVRARSPSFRGARHPCDVSRSCYLARYNQITDAPRKLIEATGAELVELRVTAQTTFCCGGGPDLEVRVRDRRDPSEQRIREAQACEESTTSSSLAQRT